MSCNVGCWTTQVLQVTTTTTRNDVCSCFTYFIYNIAKKNLFFRQYIYFDSFLHYIPWQSFIHFVIWYVYFIFLFLSIFKHIYYTLLSDISFISLKRGIIFLVYNIHITLNKTTIFSILFSIKIWCLSLFEWLSLVLLISPHTHHMDRTQICIWLCLTGWKGNTHTHHSHYSLSLLYCCQNLTTIYTNNIKKMNMIRISTTIPYHYLQKIIIIITFFYSYLVLAFCYTHYTHENDEKCYKHI